MCLYSTKYNTRGTEPFLKIYLFISFYFGGCAGFSLLLTGFLESSLVTQRVKCLPAMRDNQVRSLGQEDPLEKEMATHSGTLAWKIPWTEKPGRLQPLRLQRVGHD